MNDSIHDIIDRLGYLGVALLVALENVLPPIPSEAVLPLAGFIAGRGDASLVGMIAAATAGSVVGAWLLYGISALVGPLRLRAFMLRHRRWLRVEARHIDRAELWFASRGAIVVLVGRCVPLLRSLVSVPAGFHHMPIGLFTLYTGLGSLVWNSALIGAGALLGDQWERVGEVVGVLQTGVIVVLALVASALVWRFWLQPRLTGDPRPGAGD
ncbi:MAG: DedA family protein [Acidimicrobiales bacterium]